MKIKDMVDHKQIDYSLVYNWANAHKTSPTEIYENEDTWSLWCSVLWVSIGALAASALMSFLDTHILNSSLLSVVFILGAFATLIAIFFLVETKRWATDLRKDLNELQQTEGIGPGYISLYEAERSLRYLIENNSQKISYSTRDQSNSTGIEARRFEIDNARRLLKIFCRIH